MSRVADAARKAAAGTTGTSELAGADYASPVEAYSPLPIDSFEPPWRLEEAGPRPATVAQAVAFKSQPERKRIVAVRATSHRSALGHLAGSTREQIRGLVARVFLAPSTDSARMVAFVAVGADAGSATVVAAAAESLATQTTATVCAVDTNFAAPQLHHCFGIVNETGLAEALRSDCPLSDVAQALDSNLYVLPAGCSGERPSLAADHTRAQVAQLAKSFSYVLVSAAPLGPSGEPSEIALLVDGVVLVVAAEQTRRDLARSVVEQLRDSGVTIVGAVLMNGRSPIPEFVSRWL